MSAPGYDDPESIQREEARQELIGRGGKGGHGTEAYTVSSDLIRAKPGSNLSG